MRRFYRRICKYLGHRYELKRGPLVLCRRCHDAFNLVTLQEMELDDNSVQVFLHLDWNRQPVRRKDAAWASPDAYLELQKVSPKPAPSSAPSINEDSGGSSGGSSVMPLAIAALLMTSPSESSSCEVSSPEPCDNGGGSFGD